MMKAIVYDGPSKVKYVEDAPLPKIEKPTDAIVKITTSALCGSDLHFFHARLKVLPGTIMGHEFVGVVSELGPEAAKSGLAVGDRVGSSFATSCMNCYYCKKGLNSRCNAEDGALTYGLVLEATGKGIQGAQTEFVRVPQAAGSLVKLPPKVSDDIGLLLGDILSTGWYCAEQGGIGQQPKDEKFVVAVVGCGPVALLAIIAARIQSEQAGLPAPYIIAIDSIPERLEMAKEFGANEVVNFETGNPVDAVQAQTEGRGADVVLEVVGIDKALELSYSVIRPGGVLSSVGAHTSATGPITPGMMYGKNLTFKMGRCPTRAYFSKLLSLAEQGKFDAFASKLISHRMKLSDAVRAYDIFSHRTEGCTKVLFEN